MKCTLIKVIGKHKSNGGYYISTEPAYYYTTKSVLSAINSCGKCFGPVIQVITEETENAFFGYKVYGPDGYRYSDCGPVVY